MPTYFSGNGNYYDANTYHVAYDTGGTTTWTSNVVTSNTVTTGTTWDYWQNTGSSVRLIWQSWVDGTTIPTYQVVGPTPEAAEAIEARQREFEEAVERANALLVESLNHRQRGELARHKAFRLRGSSGGLYEIAHGRVANVRVLTEDGRVRHRLCAHPIAVVPDGDTMLAQKLMLETDEDAFLAMANVS